MKWIFTGPNNVGSWMALHESKIKNVLGFRQLQELIVGSHPELSAMENCMTIIHLEIQ
jgi:hypothetical protein